MKTFIKIKKLKPKTLKKYKLTSKNLNYKKIALYLWRKLVYPNTAQILKISLICSDSGAVVERGFSLKNMKMNKYHSLIKIRTLDALMRIYYEYDITDQDADDIVKVWFKKGNRHIDLP